MTSTSPLPQPNPTSSLSSHPLTTQAYHSSPRSPPSPPTETLILSHPSARLSSSPASSPRIVASPVSRTRSLRPEMSAYMDHGVSPGADFFDDASSDGSVDEGGGLEEDEWRTVDENATQIFSEVEGLRDEDGTDFPNTDDEGEEGEHDRRTGAGQEHLTALPPYNQIPLHDSGTATATATGNSSHVWEFSSPIERLPSRKARPVSLRRLSRGAKIVHNHTGSTGAGTSRGSAQSETGGNNNGRSDSASEVGGLKAVPAARDNVALRTRHRRNTSESLKADSIINAHAITMRALESISPSASLSLMHTNLRAQAEANAKLQTDELTVSRPLPTESSFGASRKITMAPIETRDSDRPEGLPSHFIKTPYPFSAKKEFPKPRTRPRANSLKGKQMLGLVQSDGEVDLRVKSGRNDNGGSGVRRARSMGVHKKQWPEGNLERSGTVNGGEESVVLLSLRKRSGNRGVLNQLSMFVIPNNLVTTSPRRDKEGESKIDFDDNIFAERLRSAYRSLSGSWFRRTFSVKRLKYIRLERVGTGDGGQNGAQCQCGKSSEFRRARSHLLAAGNGIAIGDHDGRSPFTEQKLMELYNKPASGKARYTWVHWARRLAASNGEVDPQASALHRGSERQNQEEGAEEAGNNLSTSSAGQRHSSSGDPDYVTTIQFVQRRSVFRITVATGLVLVLSIVAALLWIFVGVSGWRYLAYQGRGERVTAGCLIGLLVLALEMVILLVWLLFS